MGSTTTEVAAAEMAPQPLIDTVTRLLFWTALVIWIPLALLLNEVWGWGGSAMPTLGQRVFLAVGSLFLPALAAVGFGAGSGASSWSKAAALTGAGLLGFLLSAGFAVCSYPEYPRRGPHELIATATVLPALALPLAVIAFWKRLGVSPTALMACSAWALLLLAGTIVHFKRELDFDLPLSVTITRWENTDIQDYSSYLIRAEGVQSKDAERYAASLGLTRKSGSFACGPWSTAADWKPPPADAIWDRDDREAQQDLERYPSGLAGCFTRATWAEGSLYVCEVCDWGI